MAPGAKVREVARRNGVAESVVFTWRRQARTAERVVPCIAPIQIAAAEAVIREIRFVLVYPHLLRCNKERSPFWRGSDNDFAADYWPPRCVGTCSMLSSRQEQRT